MATLTGTQGNLKIDGTSVKVLRSWGANIDVDDVDITSMDSGGHKQFTPGLDGCDVEFEALLDSAQDLTIITPGAPGTIAGRSVATGTALKLGGTGYIKSLKPKVDLKGEVSITGTFKISGAYTLEIGA